MMKSAGSSSQHFFSLWLKHLNMERFVTVSGVDCCSQIQVGWTQNILGLDGASNDFKKALNL